MISIVITNQKGGVSKTTTTAELGWILAKQGSNVLMVDLDSQSSLTQLFGVSAENNSIADVFGGSIEGNLDLSDVIQPINGGLSIAPSNVLLYTTEMGLAGRAGREYILKQAFGKLSGYDVAIIDCPPGMGLLTINALVASQGVIIPSLPSVMDLRGVDLTLETIGGIDAAGLNSSLDIIGILLVQFISHTLEHNRILEAVITSGKRILGVIPRSVKVQEAVSKNKTISEYDPKGKPSEAYYYLAKIVTTWLKDNKSRR
ncbi:MAG: ParA family protein [Anaerolineae bacterium]|nr:ParA family protein [Anaerolineae bacterium]